MGGAGGDRLSSSGHQCGLSQHRWLFCWETPRFQYWEDSSLRTASLQPWPRGLQSACQCPRSPHSLLGSYQRMSPSNDRRDQEAAPLGKETEGTLTNRDCHCPHSLHRSGPGLVLCLPWDTARLLSLWERLSTIGKGAQGDVFSHRLPTSLLPARPIHPCAFQGACNLQLFHLFPVLSHPSTLPPFTGAQLPQLLSQSPSVHLCLTSKSCHQPSPRHFLSHLLLPVPSLHDRGVWVEGK